MFSEGGDETASSTSSISNESYMNDNNNNIINNNDDDENDGDGDGRSDGNGNGDRNSLKNNVLRDSLRRTRDCLKRFETNVTIHTLKNTTNICAESIKQVGNFLLIEKLLTSQSAGLLNIIAEIIHRILNLIKSEKNITKFGRNVVVSTVDTFIELIEEIMQKVGSYSSTQSWIQCSSLENLSTAFPIEACVIRKRLTYSEVQAHSKLFLFKGDLLRYRSNIMNEPFGGACKAYWIAFSLLPGQGIVFNLLGVIAAARDSTDRLSQTFYFMRAISTTTPFENAKIGLLAKLEQLSQKMIKSDFSQQFEIFKDPSVTDINGRYGLTINSTHSNEYYFAWMPSAISETSETTPPNWKQKILRFSRSMIFKMITENLFHIIYLLITKQTHSTLFPACERFLALISHILDTEEITGKELLQITTIFILGLKCRESFDESFEMLSHTFLHYIGLLFSKFYQIMIHKNNGTNFPLEQKAMIILPSIVIIESYWNSFDDKIPVDSFRSRSHTFDFTVVRKNISKLGPFLHNYIQSLNVNIKRTKNNIVADNVYLLPEVILCCMGSRFSVSTAPLHLISTTKYSETFKTFLIRILLANDLLTRMVKKKYFGIDSSYDFCPGLYDLSTFELFILAYQKNQKVYAIYPEYLIVSDTSILLESYNSLKDITKRGIKILIPNFVFSDLTLMTKDFFKPELFRASAKRVKEMICECIEKGSNEFQLFDFKGERKYNFSVDEIGVHLSKNFKRFYPPYLNKFNIIYNIYKTADEIYSVKPETYGFYAPNIKVTKVLLISSNQLSQYSHRFGIPSSTLLSFLKWFNACIGTNLTVDGDDYCKTIATVQKTPIIVKESELTKIEKYFSFTFYDLEASYPTTSLSEDHGQNDDDDYEFKYFQDDIKRSVSRFVEEDNDKHIKCPSLVQHDIVNGKKIYPVGVIPPYYVSPRRGVWILPGMEANILEPPYSTSLI